MYAFRDTDNKSLAYGPAPTSKVTSAEDSDGEALVPKGLDEDSMANFTATGRPAPPFKTSGLMYQTGALYSLPQLLPKRYTDDSIIPAIVVDVIPAAQKPGAGAEAAKKSKKNSLLSRFKSTKEDERDENGERKGITKVVYMPRRDYIRYFARDERGEYIGSEPFKRWTEEELDETFAQYKPATENPKNGKK